MKKQLASLFMPLFLLGSFSAKANSFLQGVAVDLTKVSPEWASATTTSPVVLLRCLTGEIKDGPWDWPCASASSTAATVSSSLLLKQIEAAQPDALNYLAGGAPSPALYSVVEKIQILSAEKFGQEISFDEAVNDIIGNL